MKKIVRNIIWSLLAIASVSLLIAAMRAKNNLDTAGVVINIQPSPDASFISENDVLGVLKKNGAINGTEINAVNLNNLELQLQKNPWIKNAEVFIDNKQILHANIQLRSPLARIFTVSGNSFYIDSSCTKMPLVSTMPERMIVFSSFPSDKNKLSIPDSLLMQQVKKIATFITADSFWMAQTAQVDISDEGKFILIPVLGDQQIILGNADNLDEKFRALMSFYQQAWKTLGFEKYSTISVEFSGQVVATRRGARNTIADTSMALKLFGNSNEKMEKILADTIFAAPVKSLDTTKAVQTISKKKIIPAKVKESNSSNKPVNKKTNKKVPKAILKKPTNE